MTSPVTQDDLVAGFRETGLKPGDVVLAHSAMRTFGPIEGGADAVIDALLSVIGPRGTLVVPTFTFAHEAEDDPVIDPASDRSEMGIITETARKRPDALRSTAFRHSFAAIGRRAAVITDIDPSLSSFDLRSSFGVMLGLNAQVLLLGVTYSSSTSHHFAELVCDVPYRQCIPRQVKVRRTDGSQIEQNMMDYQPKSEGGSYYGSRGPDFNRLGRMLEDRGDVGRTFIGNAAVRRFSMRALVDLAQVEAEQEFNVFRTDDGKAGEVTELEFGQCTISPDFPDGAGRPNRVQWCVRDLDQLTLPT
jgi:aminoglycoside 3-N-acetyltransferase